MPDFLPPPAELAFREEGVKVTLALSKKSVEFFTFEASGHQTQYQRRSAVCLMLTSMRRKFALPSAIRAVLLVSELPHRAIRFQFPRQPPPND